MRNVNKKNIKGVDTSFGREFPDIDIAYSETPEEVWKRISGKIEHKEEIKLTSNKRWMPLYRSAASILLLIGTTWGVLSYTKTVEVDPSGTILVDLPDGSTVLAKNSSKVRFRPYGWYFQRKVSFSGEGFFRVKKGSRFVVESPMGSTEVLGTSFNVLAYKETFEVACYTGKVKVVTKDHEEVVVLHPKDSMTKLGDDKVALRKQNTELSAQPSWMEQKFSFHRRSIYYIITRLELEYNVKIEVPKDLGFRSTLIFNRPKTIYNALNLVCKPLGLSFVEEKKGFFVLTKP